ncbi:HIRAN domain-containing protein [Microbacterium gorillae]|uniref:HIRAN domain-containing protein n=1 Tax=Microbacterium gorillae TaxID=1231063 RepID=UPI0018A837C4|nr:HIRAN domain-containing protein [Microbacterium gorillae]
MGLLDSIRSALGLSRPVSPAPTATEARPVTFTITASADDGARRPHPRGYLDSSELAALLIVGADGMPPLRLSETDGQLWLIETTTGKRVNVDARQLRHLGIWGVKVRGTSYYDGVTRLGPAQLVREPDNLHDPHAVAVHVDGQIIGHWNKGMAPGLAKLLDSGAPLAAEVIAIEPAKVIAAHPGLLAYLHRAT